MKFSCGDTEATRIAKWKARVAALGQWHDFFALIPRTIAQENGKEVCAWLETIERRGTYGYSYWRWEYRAKPS